MPSKLPDTPDTPDTIDVRNRRDFRKWLKKHHDSLSEIWLVFHKRHTGVTSIKYDDAVEEALCFGWIDSIIRRLDDARYARKFTPRKADSKWSTVNRRRYASLESRGLLAKSGLKRPPTSRRGDAPKPSVSANSLLHHEDVQGQSTCLAVFRTVGSVISTGICRLDRLGQARRNEGETSSRGGQPISGWRGRCSRRHRTHAGWIGAKAANS